MYTIFNRIQTPGKFGLVKLLISDGKQDMKTRIIERRRLGEQIYDVLAGQIIDGKYPPGTHLSEINLCTEMGVSRTPVREAMFKLEEKGLVVSHPNRGFFVPALDKPTVSENYPILASLDALALSLSPAFTHRELGGIISINRQIKKTGEDPVVLYQLDLDFHDCLIKNCPNKRLLKLIEDLKFETRQRDGGYKRGLADRDLAHTEHSEIIAFLEKGNNKMAAKALEKHWLGGIKTVTDWIDSKAKETHHGTRKTA